MQFISILVYANEDVLHNNFFETEFCIVSP